jgi:hypothetical protein
MKVRLLETLERCLAKKRRQGGIFVRTPHWSTRLELALAEPNALRVLDTASIIQD